MEACKTHAELAHHLFEGREVSEVLFKGSPEKEDIEDLQRVLNELGYSKELKFDQFGADGDYGNATTAAVKALADNNGIPSDGTVVTNPLLEKGLTAHFALPNLSILFQDLQRNEVTKKYKPGGNKVAIAALQTLLNDLGFGAEMNFEKFGADGIYGGGTTAAMKAFADKHGVAADGARLTPELAQLILDQFRPMYGEAWMALSKRLAAVDGRRALVNWQGSNMRPLNQPIQVDKQFMPLMDRINEYAKQAEVTIVVTSSFRTTTNVKGAIVPPAKMSNHLVGHAIDMNVQFASGFANSGVLKQFPNVPNPVRTFIQSIRNDADLRWGGDFNTPDVVHIDDRLNLNDAAKWRQRYDLLQRTAQGL